MIRRIVALAVLGTGLLAVSGMTGTSAQPKQSKPEDLAKARAALKDLQEYVGLWNLEGTQKVGTRIEAWKEQVSWGWKFKDGEAWFVLDFADGKGKFFTTGELRYDVMKHVYVLTLTAAEKGAEKQVYEGTFARNILKFERKDAKGDVYRITMNTAAEGARLQMKFERQDGGKGLPSELFAMKGTKEGASFAGGGKKPECIVSGGAANIMVSYMGKTYYVCCTGCRDEFNANPAKYVKEK